MPESPVVEEDVPLDELEDEIRRLSAHLSAAMCRWLLLVAEFDRREGWATDGVRSCAHWLNWKCGLSMAAAHEHVRVARRLVELPALRQAFGEGRISYSKARAVSRIATPASEAELVGLAAHTTAAQLERVARARRSVSTDETEAVNRRHEARHVHWFWDDDGSLVLTARLDPEEGALVLQALDAAAHARRDDAARARPARSPDSSAGDTAGQSPDSSAEDTAGRSPDADPGRLAEARAAGIEADRRPGDRADALVTMAETMLAHGPAARDGGDRYQAVVLVDAAVLAGGEGRCHLDDGPALAHETALRLACDAAVVAMSLRDGGEPLDVGRSTQAIPRAIRRALRVRDGGCRFPGCTQRRFVDGHHVVHWSKGGETSLANLVLLCRFHHRAVHEGGYGLRRLATGELVFTAPNGDVLHRAPATDPVDLDVDGLERHLGLRITASTGACLWGGERLDVGLAVDGILGLEESA